MLGGFAMQASLSSRAASGAEHQFSHVWDMQHHVHQGHAPSHGFKVAIGTQATTALFEFMLEQPLEKLDVDARCAAWPDADAWCRRARELLGDGDLMEVAEKELRDGSLVALPLGRRKLRRAWGIVHCRSRPLSLPEADFVQLCRRATAAFDVSGPE